jgi:pimeloyl-ACP methyl ester carboxylesterase
MISLPWLSTIILFFFQLHYTAGQSLNMSSDALARSVQTTGYLTVPGASLYYETYGTGPLLLFISGANGDADIWRPLAQTLSSATPYTVAIYDRRGFSRSYLSSTAAQNYTDRLSVDVNDVKRLTDHLSPKEPATVLGTSSGAIVALQFLLTHPDNLKTLIAHEPPALSILPDADALQAAQRAVYATYRAVGVPASMLQFAYLQDPTFTPTPGGNAGFVIDTRRSPFSSGNLQYWFEREFLQYPLQEFDVEEFKHFKEKLVLANGNKTNVRGSQYRANLVIGEQVGLEVRYLAGEHVGYSGDTTGEFAKDLMGVLEGR